MAKKFRRKNLVEISSFVVILFFVLFSLFPFYWMSMTTFKTPITLRSLVFLPYFDFKPDFETWSEVLGFQSQLYPGHAGDVRRALINGFVVAGTSATLSMLIGALAGYALSRFKFRRWKNDDIALFILSMRIMPPVVAILPLFLMFMNLNMLDTYPALILVHTAVNLPFSVWLLRDFFSEVPKEIEEAAYVDGANLLQTFSRISLPLVLPGFAIAWIICFIFSWNEFITILALSYSQTITMPWTIAIAAHFRRTSPWLVCADGIIAVLPPIILISFIQKYLVRGLTFGAVKG